MCKLLCKCAQNYYSIKLSKRAAFFLSKKVGQEILTFLESELSLICISLHLACRRHSLTDDKQLLLFSSCCFKFEISFFISMFWWSLSLFTSATISSSKFLMVSDLLGLFLMCFNICFWPLWNFSCWYSFRNESTLLKPFQQFQDVKSFKAKHLNIRHIS